MVDSVQVLIMYNVAVGVLYSMLYEVLHAPQMTAITLALLSLTDTELSDATQRYVPTGFKAAALNLWNLEWGRGMHMRHKHVHTRYTIIIMICSHIAQVHL